MFGRIRAKLTNYENARMELAQSRLWPTVCALGALACRSALISMEMGHEAAEHQLSWQGTSVWDRRR